MKTLKKHINESIFILESNDGWLNDFINEIKNTNTNGKLQEFFPLYGVDIQRDYNREAISRYSWTPETDDTILKRINNVVVTNFLTIYVVTMKKGNYYGIPKDWRTHMPKYTKLLPLFNKRVKGTKGMLFTDDVDNIKKYISTCTTNYLIDVPLTDEYYYGKYIYTSKENAALAAKQASKLHKRDVKVQYYDSKVDELNELIKNSENAIKELELELQNRRKLIEGYKEDLAEYKNLSNFTAMNLDESMMIDTSL